MTVLASDNFNRANESPLASPWTNPSGFGNLRLVSNQVATVSGNTDSQAQRGGVTWPADQYSKCTIAVLGAADGGPMVRGQSSGDCYFVTAFTTTTIELFLISGGGFNNIATYNLSGYTANDVVQIEAQGTTIRVKLNTVTVITTTDGTLSSGNAGMHLFDGTMRVDDWEGGDFSAGGGTTTTKTMEDTLVISDQVIKGAKRGRVTSDTIIVSEPALQRTFVVTAFDELTIADETIRYLRLARQASDTIVVTDAIVKWLRRTRSSSDNVSVIDEIIKSVTGSGTVFSQVVGDTIVVSDGFVNWLRYRRLATDLFEITDGSLKTIIGAGTVYAKVTSDSVVLVDDAGQRYVFRKAILSDALGINDAVVRALVRGRVAGDDLVIFDGTVTVSRYIRTFTDSIVVAEEVLRAYLPAQTFQVRIRLGVAQEIEIGVRSSGISLGVDAAISLGVDQ